MIHVVETKPHQIVDDDTRFTFIGSDQKSYDAVFTAAVRAQLLALLQVEIARRRECDLIPLTLAGSAVKGSAAGFALVIDTEEAGPIGFRISPDGRAALRKSLSELEALPEPQQRM